MDPKRKSIHTITESKKLKPDIVPKENVDCVTVLHQLIQGSILLKLLDNKAVFQLTLVSKGVSNLFRPLIEEKYTFNVFKKQEFRGFMFYKPISVKVPSIPALHKLAQDYPTISQVVFFRDFNQVIKTLPQQITQISFGTLFCQSVATLPNHITHINFGFDYNIPISTLPLSLTHLVFGWEFSKPIHSLPSTLTHLVFGWNFNSIVENYPSNLLHLTYGYKHNQKVDNLCTAHKLTHLQMGTEFDQFITKFPPNLTHLEFPGHFNQLLPSLPPKLIYLKFSRWNQPLPILPKTLKYFECGEIFNQFFSQLPPALEILVLGERFGQYENLALLAFPPTLKKIYVRRLFAVTLPKGCKMVQY
eukprot:TRINITY_DN6742_c0_g2_i1.p1 TRINITY_DN6742_c0_g2~~TRINITY_DN6742_c0_g2_i1.p1  ORF type:complete len:360 (+),score=56.17 TRINITY_DN6742_c0_g2_i1:153-1232(+)